VNNPRQEGQIKPFHCVSEAFIQLPEPNRIVREVVRLRQIAGHDRNFGTVTLAPPKVGVALRRLTVA
jgi:hypothetical protein